MDRVVSAFNFLVIHAYLLADWRYTTAAPLCKGKKPLTFVPYSLMEAIQAARTDLCISIPQ